MLVCLLLIDRKSGAVVRGPELLGKGVAGLDETRSANARQGALDALSELGPLQRTDHASVEEAMRRGVRSAWKRGQEKRPMVLPVVIVM
jgi:ribonuclease J